MATTRDDLVARPVTTGLGVLGMPGFTGTGPAVRARPHIDSPMMSGHTPAVRRFSVRLSRKKEAVPLPDRSRSPTPR